MLITGGLGGIAKGGLVSFLGTLYQLRLSHYRKPKKACKYEFVKADVRNHKEVEKGVNGVDIILHLASKGARDPLGVDPKEAFPVNVIGTLNLIEAAKKYGIQRFIFTSSICAYGLSKRLAENLLEGCSQECDFPITVFRLGYVMRKNYDYGAQLRELKKNPLLRRGDFWNYIDVRDVGEAIKLAIERDLTGYQVFNLTAEDHFLIDQDSLTLFRKYYPQVKKVYNKNGFLIGGNKSFIDISKIKKKVGFRPKFALKRYLDWISSGNREEDYYLLRE